MVRHQQRAHSVFWQSLFFACAVTVCMLAFTVNYGWLRSWFPNIHQLWIIAINPGSLLVLIFAAWSLFILKRKDSVRLSAVSLFTWQKLRRLWTCQLAAKELQRYDDYRAPSGKSQSAVLGGSSSPRS